METLTTLERAIRLQKVELFSDLRTDELALVASIASQVRQQSGDVLFRENAPSDALFVVLAGRRRNEPRRAGRVCRRRR